MTLRLTPQQQRIVDFLDDGEWKCMAAGFYLKDDRKRISELNALGYTINGMKCDGSCGVKHSSRVFMRRLEEKYVPKRQIVIPTLINGVRGVKISWV